MSSIFETVNSEFVLCSFALLKTMSDLNGVNENASLYVGDLHEDCSRAILLEKVRFSNNCLNLVNPFAPIGLMCPILQNLTRMGY